MPVIYDGKKIIPGPFVSIVKDFQKSEDGTTRKIVYNITVKGKIVAFAGSPDSTGAFWTASGYPADEVIAVNSRLASLRNKKGALCKLFCTEGKTFEVQPYDGTAPIKCNPRVKSVEFAEGQWFNYVDFTIQLEADKLWFGELECCGGSDASTLIPEESWSIEQADERGRTFRLSHTVTASAKKTYDENGNATEGWTIAKTAVLTKLGLDSQFLTASGVLDLSGSTGAYNYVRSQTVDEAAGRFSVTETWLAFDPSSDPDATGHAAIEDFTINIRTAADSGKTTASIEGTIQGLEVRNNTTHALTSTRWTNAQAKWAAVQPLLLSRAQSAAGTTLNTEALNTQIGKNQINGVITYSWDYDNRPTNDISGAITESITVVDDYPTDVFASLVAMNRVVGPILQSIGTVTASKRTVNIEAQLRAKSQSFNPTKPTTNPIIVANLPSYSIALFKDRDEESWSAQTGRYTRTVSWTYE